MMDKFQDIRPYTNEEAVAAIPLLVNDPDFAKAIKLLHPDVTIDSITTELKEAKSIFDFQKIVCRRFIEYFMKIGSYGVTFSGIENVKPDEPCLFIANHRDISLDSAILHHYFFNNGFDTAKIAIGDNLLYTPSLAQFAKINKMFLVKRSASLREKIVNYQILSEYIANSILIDKGSVWIAQRNGRTKNGIDQTQHGLIKMLAMSGGKFPMERLQQLRLTPISISYEYEPCAHFKARENVLSQNKSYVKLPDEDFNSIKEGLFSQKGRIHLTIGTPIAAEIDAIASQLPTNEKIVEVSRLVDKQIYKNYYLFPNNYIAYDCLMGEKRFAAHYTQQEKSAFLSYLMKKSVMLDVEPDVIYENLLQIYANPVRTCLLGEVPDFRTHEEE